MLKEDYELSREDIQFLSCLDALTAFFAKLGYDTNVWLVQHAAAMGISRDNLVSAIAHIERLANRSNAGFTLEIYLSREPEESGVVHDLLAMLAGEMIRLNKEKRATKREFLDWLVADLKILPDKEGRKE